MTDPHRLRLPQDRASITHKVVIHDEHGDYSVYMTVGLFPKSRRRVSEQPGELFIHVGKAGSTLNGDLDIIGIMWSMSLQYGIPLLVLCNKFEGMTYSPYGDTSNPDIPHCTSIIDYVARWHRKHYLA